MLYNFKTPAGSTDNFVSPKKLEKLKLNETQKFIIESYYNVWWATIEGGLIDQSGALLPDGELVKIASLIIFGLCNGVKSEYFDLIVSESVISSQNIKTLNALDKVIRFSAPFAAGNQIANNEDIYNHCFSEQHWQAKGETFVQRKTIVANYMRQLLLSQLLSLTHKLPDELIKDCNCIYKRSGLDINTDKISQELERVMSMAMPDIEGLEVGIEALDINNKPPKPMLEADNVMNAPKEATDELPRTFKKIKSAGKNSNPF